MDWIERMIENNNKYLNEFKEEPGERLLKAYSN